MDNANEQLIKIRTRQLLEKWINEGDVSARDEVFELNQKLVYYVAHSFKNVIGKLLSFEDLVSFCNIGFLKALNTFDLTNTCSFSTYASQIMRNEVRMELRRAEYVKDEVSLNQKVRLPSEDNVEVGDMIAGENNIDEFIEHDSNPSEFDLLTQFLSQADRDFVKLAYFYDANNDEIAKELNINSDDVRPYLLNIIKCSRHRCKGIPRVSLFEQRELLLHDDDFARFVSNLDERKKATLESAFEPQMSNIQNAFHIHRAWLEDDITRFKLSKVVDMDFGIDRHTWEIVGTIHRGCKKNAQSFVKCFPNGIKKVGEVERLLSPVEIVALEKNVLQILKRKSLTIPCERESEPSANELRLSYDCMTQKFAKLESVENLDTVPDHVLW